MSTPKAESMSFSALLSAGTVCVVVAVLVSLLAPVLFRGRVDELRAERGWTTTPAETQQLRAAQQDRIARYVWIDRAHGVVALPIERAMQLAIDDLNKPHSGPGVGR